jgi:uncharacterized membrane protein
MNLEIIEQENKRSFQVEHENVKYGVNVWLDSDSYKFIDWEVWNMKTGENVSLELEDEIIQRIEKELE